MGSNPVYGGTLIDKKDSRGRLIARGAYWDEGRGCQIESLWYLLSMAEISSSLSD